MSQQSQPGFIPGGGIDLSPLVENARRAQTPGADGLTRDANGAPGGGQVVDVASVIMDVTDDTFNQVSQLSNVVPVIVDLWAEWCQPCKTLGPILEKLTRELGGRAVLAKVDVDANPGLAQAFQAQSIPLVVALVKGQPVQLFTGAQPEEQVRQVLGQLLQLAEQQGVTGRVAAPDLEGSAAPAEAAPAPLPPKHAEAFEAIERGDYAAAAAAYQQAMQQNPRDDDARAGLAQVNLLIRLQGKTLDEIRARAGAEPDSLDAQLDVADLDVSGGHIEDGFVRLLDEFARRDGDEQVLVRERLVELFEVVGHDDPRVAAARRRLATLLY